MDCFLCIKKRIFRFKKIETRLNYSLLPMNRRDFISNALTAAAAPSISLQKPTADETRKRVMRVAHLTDIHVHADKVAEEGMARALQSVQQLNPKADFVINGGDAIMDALEKSKEEVRQQWDIFKGILKAENTLPTFHVIGNHDVYGWFNK
jgi:3',5'-cyclic-AMP phosphodiesterase